MKRAPLSELATINPRAPRSILEAPSAPASFLAMSSVSEDGCVAFEDERSVGEVSKGYTYFERGDVLLAKITPCMENGKAAYLESLKHPIGFGSSEFHVLRPGPDVDGKYLFYCIWNPRFRFLAERNMTGSAGQKRVPTDFLRRFSVPLPPLDQQRRIAAILEKAEAIRSKRQHSITLAEDLLRSAFLEMFGDPHLNPHNWDVCELRDVVHPDFPVTYGIVQAGPHVDSGIPYIKAGDIKDGRVDPASLSRTSQEIAAKYARSAVREGDLVITIRATVGVLVEVGPELEGANLTQGTARISPGPAVRREYLLWCLQSDALQSWLQRQVKGATFKEITLGRLRQAPIPVPPLSSQDRFSAAVNRIGRMRSRIDQSTEQARDLFDSLSHCTFRGEL